MSLFKQLSVGSPFQFRSAPEQLAPLLQDVKSATITYCPLHVGPGRGLLINVIQNLHGRVHKRLCPKTTVEYIRKDVEEPATLHVEYVSGQTAVYTMDKKYRNIRDLMYDMYNHRTRLKYMDLWKKSHTIYHPVQADESVDATMAAKKSKMSKKR